MLVAEPPAPSIATASHQTDASPLCSCFCSIFLQVTRCVTNVGSDVYTGVRAALITRSGNPIWVPASLKDVSAPQAPACWCS